MKLNSSSLPSCLCTMIHSSRWRLSQNRYEAPISPTGPGFKRGHVFRGKKTHLQRAPSYLPDPRLVGSLVPFPKCHSMHLKTRHKVASGLQEPRGFTLRTAQEVRRRGPLGCSFPEGGEGGRFSDYHGASMSVGTKPLGMYLGKTYIPLV